MKKLSLLLIVVFCSLFAHSQSMTNAKFRVLDSETKEGIEGVDVLIQELMIVEKTKQYGIASFEKVPIRQVTVEIRKEGYLPQKIESNLTNNPFDNNYSVELLKKKDNVVPIFGTIKGKGKRVENANISIRIGGFKRAIQSDDEGDFFIEIPKDKIKSNVELMIRHREFRDKELVVDLKQGQQYKDLGDINLDYSGGNIREMRTIGRNSNNYWDVQVKKWTQEENIVSVSVIIENIHSKYPSRNLSPRPSEFILIDDNVSSYKGIEFKLGNTTVNNDQWQKIPVPFGSKPIAVIKFDVGDMKISGLSMLQFEYEVNKVSIDIPISK